MNQNQPVTNRWNEGDKQEKNICIDQPPLLWKLACVGPTEKNEKGCRNDE